ncbi:hypothetical protein AK812_SmicGene48279, partial [Symbiodinium microadriaticum]
AFRCLDRNGDGVLTVEEVIPKRNYFGAYG